MSKSPNNVALMIGRGGSSLKDKNILPVLGFPLLQWTAAAAIRSRYIGRYYISSDCPRILKAAAVMGYKPIHRPPYLCTPDAQSSDAVGHALEEIEKDCAADVLVVQHANVGTVTESLIDACLEELVSNENASSVVPCHENPEYHPLRAKRLNSKGFLLPFVESKGFVSANRQDLPNAYFFDHSIWVLRAESIRTRASGQPPWPCMGNSIKPYITQGTMDVHSHEDLKKTEQWLLEHKIARPDQWLSPV